MILEALCSVACYEDLTHGPENVVDGVVGETERLEEQDDDGPVLGPVRLLLQLYHTGNTSC